MSPCVSCEKTTGALLSPNQEFYSAFVRKLQRQQNLLLVERGREEGGRVAGWEGRREDGGERRERKSGRK